MTNANEILLIATVERNRILPVETCKTQENVADGMTKPLGKP